MFLKNRNISSKIKRSKVTDYAALTYVLISIVIKRTHVLTHVVTVNAFVTTAPPHPPTQTHLRDTVADSGVIVDVWTVITS